MQNWLPWPNRGRITILPRTASYPASPYDLDAGERIDRRGAFPSVTRPFPYPPMIGCYSGFMPQMDGFQAAISWGKTPSGPSVGGNLTLPMDLQYFGTYTKTAT